MAITLDGLELPGDLIFADEFTWSPVARGFEYSLAGSVLIDESVKLAGRPITLEANNEFLGHIWISRTLLASLVALVDETDHTMTLVLEDAQTFSVRFREEGVIAEPVYHVAAHQGNDPYHITIKLLTV